VDKWRTRFSLAPNREIATAIVDGARNARDGERLLSCGRLHGFLRLFESEQLRLRWDFRIRVDSLLFSKLIFFQSQSSTLLPGNVNDD
jgi:hypothetical protein